ncbi:MAG: ATP-dependent zinc protease [Gemmatimonadetes bacterium]|nr:ATP-dependent zinc protease [Gemmatimonadota bacterium]
MKELEVIGWREWVGLPDLAVERIKAKVDTGARTSSLHAFDMEHFSRRNQAWIHFSIHPMQRDSKQIIECEFPIHDLRTVRSSNGRKELRPVIRTHLHLNGDDWLIDLNLTSRDLMGFRMLLGREAVRNRYAVNPGRSFLVRELVPRRLKKRSLKKRKISK